MDPPLDEAFTYEAGFHKFDDFESRYKKFSLKIENATLVSKQFAECSSNENSISYLMSNSLLTSLLRDSFTLRIKASKAQKNSRFYRDLGNRAYQLKQYPQALELYNKSLLSAEIGSEEMSIIYANRSAVFFELKKFDACLQNLEVALQGGYPERLRFKLIERRAKTKKALGIYSEVVVLETPWRDAIRAADLTEEKQKEMMRVIDLIMRECRSKEDVKKEKNERTTLLDEALDEVNAAVPAMSNVLEVKFTVEMGRHIVAKEDIAPGTKLVVEKPYASVLLPDHYATHCSHCLQYCILPVACPDCSKIGFCSNGCREAAHPVHSLECKILPSLILLDVGKMALLSTRILIQAVVTLGFDSLEALVRQNCSTQAYDENGVYRSDNYLPILHLVGNREKRRKSDIFKRSVISYVIANLLVAEGVIGHDRHSLASEVILIHLMNLPCNAHEISELAFQGRDLRSGNFEEIGAGAFATLSLLNHSCSPNVVRHSCGTYGVVTSVRSIRKGEQIFDNYGYHFALHDQVQRQKVLKDQYFFRCACEACSKNYPKYPDIEPIESVKLPSDSPLGKRLENVSESFVDSLESFVSLEIDETTLDDPILSEMFDTSRELLSLMDTAEVTYPSQMYCDAQEVLKQVLSMKGNVRT